jgi:hypothetical protein
MGIWGSFFGAKADHSFPTSADVKNTWIYKSTASYAFMEWYFVERRYNFNSHCFLNLLQISTVKIMRHMECQDVGYCVSSIPWKLLERVDQHSGCISGDTDINSNKGWWKESKLDLYVKVKFAVASS